MTRRTSFALLTTLLCFQAGAVPAAEPTVKVDAAGADRVNAPVVVKLEAADVPTGAVTLKSPTGEVVPGQVDKSGDATIVRFVAPHLPAGQSRSYAVTKAEAAPATFRFADGDGYRDLLHGDTPVWRNMTRWDPADRDNTFKPYQHVYATGSKAGEDDFITKGPGGKFTHHRGLFFGFKASAGGEDLGDYWHGRGVTQRHVKYLTDQEFTGPVAARCAAVTEWVAKDEKPILRDTRTNTIWRLAPDQFILDYDIKVESLLDKPVRIFADPQHGGFHFRAAQEVAEATGADGKPGAAVYTRPASAKDMKNDVWADCSWVQSAFQVKGKAYVVTLLDHPSNPRPTRFSTRSYGRFGAYFEAEVAPSKPLELRYRVLIQGGGGKLVDGDLAWRDFTATP